MSKCYPCEHANWLEAPLVCGTCKSGDKRVQRSAPITTQPPVTHIYSVEKYVDVVASGYEWVCPLCGYINKMDTAPNSGDMVYCQNSEHLINQYFKAMNVDHVYN